MDWTRLYIRFSLSLILYIAYVMVLPFFGASIGTASLLAALPVAIVATVKVWPGIFLGLLNAPVTLIVTARTLGSTIADGIAALLPSLVAVVAIGTLTGFLVQVRRRWKETAAELDTAKAQSEAFRIAVGEGVEQTLERFRTLAGLVARGPGAAASGSETVTEIDRHIDSLRDVYRLLYSASEPPSAVDLGRFLPDLAARTMAVLGAEAAELNRDLDPWRVPPAQAALLGTAIVEMATNSVRFGAGVDASVVVDLELVLEGDRVELRFLDHGTGFPDPVLYGQRNSGGGLGIPIVREIVTRLGGSLQLVNETGACYVLEFPAILT